MISNRFIPTEEVRRLTIGSYEHLIARIEEAVRSDVRIFGSKVEARIVGTFTGYAIALAEDGRFARVKYDEVQGAIRVLGHEMLKVPSYAPGKELNGYLKTESLKAVESFMSGDAAGAMARMKELGRFVERTPAQNDAQVTEGLIAFHRSDRPWKQVFRDKADHIRRTVLDEIASISEDRLQVKFSSLYDGSANEADLEKYRELVIENLNKIGERADGLLQQLVAACAVQSGSVQTPVVTSLFAFADDLVEDLRTVKKVAHESGRQMERVDCIGKLHDSLAADFQDRVIASRFVLKMTQRLSDNS